jgi:hypothetical protein
MIWNFNAFDAHDAHEVISWIRKIWALVTDGAEVLNCLVSIVEIDDITLGQKHQFIEDVEDVGIGLMNCLNDSSSLAC